METLQFWPFSVAYMAQLALMMIRIGIFFGMVPVLRRHLFNTPVLVSFSACCALCISGVSPENTGAVPAVGQLMAAAVCEICNGFLLSFGLNIVFEIFRSAGQMISLWTGMSAAVVTDPSMGSVTDISRFFVFVGVLLFLLQNGHLQLLGALSHSFMTAPPGHFIPGDKWEWQSFSSGCASIFSAGLMISVPIMMVSLIINLSLAMCARFSPQIGIFSIGLPLMIISGMIFLYIIWDSIVVSMSGTVVHGVKAVSVVIAGGQHG